MSYLPPSSPPAPLRHGGGSGFGTVATVSPGCGCGVMLRIDPAGEAADERWPCPYCGRGDEASAHAADCTAPWLGGPPSRDIHARLLALKRQRNSLIGGACAQIDRQLAELEAERVRAEIRKLGEEPCA